MELCRLCAASLTRSSSFIDATMAPKSVAATTIAFKQRLSGNSQRPPLNPRQQQHRGISQQRLQQPTRHLSHQIQLQSQQQQQQQQHPGRPKSFKELVEMQKRERESESRPSTPEKTFIGDDSRHERLNDSVDNFVEGSADADAPSKRSSLVQWIPSKIRRRVAKMIRRSNEFDAKMEATLQKELPAFRHALLENYAKQNKLVQDSELIMHATTRQMFFYGHPFRGAIMIASTSPMLFIDELHQVSPTLTTATLLSYAFCFWYFYLAKLTQSVWFDSEKDMYYIFMPYYQSAPITFKPGHVTEIDDLFANLNIRGIKAYCPKELFYDANDYLRMFRSEKGLRR